MASAIGAMIELALTKHWNGTAQLIPWVVAYASVAVAWAIALPTRRIYVYAARFACLVIVVACLYGTVLHFHGNWQFAREVNRGGSTFTVAGKALLGGIPLLAPMILSIPAVLLGVCTIDHPALGSDEAQPIGDLASRSTREPGAGDAPDRVDADPTT